MDRCYNQLFAAYQVQENESLVSNDYNWDELSVGDNTAAGDRFFGRVYTSRCVILVTRKQRFAPLFNEYRF